MTIVHCKKCSKQFNAKPAWIKIGHGIFCSSTCQYQAARKGKIMSCSVCAKEVYKSPKALRGSKSGKYFCSKSCQTKWRNTEFSQDKHPNWKTGEYAYRNLLLKQGVETICKLCKTADLRVLAVHHIDKNHFNNDIENLAWLCHNCHHLVHHDLGEYERFMAAIV